MTENLRFHTLATIIILALSACTFPPTPTPPPPPTNPKVPTTEPTLELIVGADTSVPFNAVGQVITFTYQIKNIGSLIFPGPVTVADDKATTSCPDVNTVGNQDGNLDPNEMIPCTGTYTITQADLDTGSVTTVATASVGESVSTSIPTPVILTQNRALTLSKTADPETYNSVGQSVIYSYTITNSGNVTLDPVQFSISDDKIGVPFNCGTDATSLAPNATVNCSATYLITQADLVARFVTNNASASDGTTTSNNATTTINRPGTCNQIQPSTTLVPGTTISHTVVKGEWLWQIAHCYGADPRQVVNANKGRLSDPAKLVAGMTVTVPNIGSERTLYGPQKGDDLITSCAPSHLVQSGDTWASIAENCNASQFVLQDVNPGVALSPGNMVRVPFNSADATTYTPLPQTQPITQPIRINFAPGATSTVVSGFVGMNGHVSYVLYASQGQVMTVQLSAPVDQVDQVDMTIHAPNGNTLKSLDTHLTWSETLLATGDYRIEVFSVLGAFDKSYTLAVSITPLP